jgi:bifunctional non-homologous end joining protein LigD
MATPRRSVEVDGRQLALSNLDKVLYPATGTTKGEVVDYYTRIAPVLLPHLAGRPVTLRRCPDGVEGECFYEKNCPDHRPEWVATVETGDGPRYCRVDERATLVWLANLAAIELHPSLHLAERPQAPTAIVFDLDPGPPAGILDTVTVALRIRDVLEHLNLRSWPKTSGRKGVQVYLPLNTGVPYEEARPFAHAIALLLERQHPDRVVSKMTKALRRGKVLIDWSQNNRAKTTIGVYALREHDRPTVSAPITWDEVERAGGSGDESLLSLRFDEVLERVGREGDLFAEVLTVRQELPDVRSAVDV